MKSVLCLLLILIFIASSNSAPSNICRVTGLIRVSCPADYHCCGDDECCKLTFREDDDDDMETTSGEVSEHPGGFYKSEPLLILARIVIITITVSFLYFISRYLKCKAFKPDIRRLTMTSLPRYKHLEKESATSLNISTVGGSPYNETSIAKIHGAKVTLQHQASL